MNRKHWMLISVCERDIVSEQFETYEDARSQMLKELGYEFEKEYTEDWEEIKENGIVYTYDDFGFDKFSAWSNIDDDCNCDWLIVGID